MLRYPAQLEVAVPERVAVVSHLEPLEGVRGCEFERTTLSYGTMAWDLGGARWFLPTGEWHPAVQLGLSYWQVYGTRKLDESSTGLAVHLGLGVEWRFSERVPVALRAGLRGTAGAYAGDDYLGGAAWSGLLVGVGF